MKEWIYKDGSGEYVLTTDPEVANLVVDALEVPEGAEILVYWDGEIKNYFYKENSLIFKNGFWGEVRMGYRMEHILNGWAGKILWQRQSTNETEYLLQGKNGDYLLESIEKLKEDNVNHPSHYCGHPSGIECIDAIESSMSEEAFKGFLKGNIQKYIWRYEGKGGLESLHKAEWYIRKLIGVIECSMEKDSVD